METAKEKLIKLIEKLDEKQIRYLLVFIPKRFTLKID